MERYEKVRDSFLGQGAFGVVEKCARKADGQIFACKTIRFRDNDKHRASALQEYAILSRLNHPHIVSYVDIVWEPSAVQIFMSFCGGGSLADFIESRNESVSERYIGAVFLQLSSALLYCHNGITFRNDGSATGGMWDWDPILHRDIKPVLLSTEAETEDVTVKLGDFGLSTFVNFEKAPSTYAGTKQYLAPVSIIGEIPDRALTCIQEITRSRRSGTYWTKMCDMFSLGCSIWELGTLKAPFSGHMDDDDTYDDLPEVYTDKLNATVKACMSTWPERRPDVMDLIRSLRRYQSAAEPDQSNKEILQRASASESTNMSLIEHPADANAVRDWTRVPISTSENHQTLNLSAKTRVNGSFSDPVRPQTAAGPLNLLAAKSPQEVSYDNQRIEKIGETLEALTGEQVLELDPPSPEPVTRETTASGQPNQIDPPVDISQISTLSSNLLPESMPIQSTESGRRSVDKHEGTPISSQKSPTTDAEELERTNTQTGDAGSTIEQQEPGLPLNLTIRTACSRLVETTTEDSVLVRGLKQRLTDDGYTKPENQMLLYGRTVLQDDTRVSHYGIPDRAILDVGTIFVAQAQQLGPNMTVGVGTKYGKTMSISIGAECPCEAIKAIIWERTGTPMDHQKLTHFGVTLEDTKTLKDCAIIDGSKIDLDVPLDHATSRESALSKNPFLDAPVKLVDRPRRQTIQYRPKRSRISKLFSL